MKRWIGALVALATMGFAAPAFACGGDGTCHCQQAQKADESEADDEGTDAEATAEAELNVQGMSCGKCASHLASAIEEIEGVVEVDVSFEEESATVRYNSDQTDPTSLVDTIESTHNGKFTAELLSQTDVTS